MWFHYTMKRVAVTDSWHAPLFKKIVDIIVTIGFYYDVKNDPISDVRTLQFLTACRLC